MGSFKASRKNKKNEREGDLDKTKARAYTLHGYDKYYYNNHGSIE
jgi:hypothetical protein